MSSKRNLRWWRKHQKVTNMVFFGKSHRMAQRLTTTSCTSRELTQCRRPKTLLPVLANFKVKLVHLQEHCPTHHLCASDILQESIPRHNLLLCPFRNNRTRCNSHQLSKVERGTIKYFGNQKEQRGAGPNGTTLLPCPPFPQSRQSVHKATSNGIMR